MKRTIISILFTCLTAITVVAQECSLPIGIALKKDAPSVALSSQRALANRLRQMLTTNGVSALAGQHAFALVASYEVVGQSVTPGPPRQMVCQLQLNLSVVCVNDGVVFATYTTKLDGVGQSEQTAISNALSRLTPRHQGATIFVGTAQQKILAYYEAQSVAIIRRAQMLDETRHYDEAISLLLTIPECCTAHERALEVVMEVWQHRINVEGERLLAKAKAVWASRTNSDAALEAAHLLSEIDPESSSYAAAEELLAEIKSKAEENTPWDVALKVLDNGIDMAQRRLDAAKEVAIAFAQNQQKDETNLLFLDK